MKIKLYTHTYLDGVGCAILGKLVFGENIDVEYHNYDTLNERIIEFITTMEYKNYDQIFMTDLHVSEEVAYLIDMKMSEKFYLLDHHTSAEWLNKYSWAKVVDKENGSLVSGTKLFSDFINKYVKNPEHFYERVNDFVDLVVDLDTWQWVNKDPRSKNLADMLNIYGIEKFVEKYVMFLKTHRLIWFDKTDTLLLDLEQEKIQNYIKSKSKHVFEKEILGYNAGIVFAEEYHSELGASLANNNPKYDFIVIINMSGSTSYRGAKDNINLGENIAKIYEGGGHPKAAGSPISDEIKKMCIDLIFNVN